MDSYETELTSTTVLTRMNRHLQRLLEDATDIDIDDDDDDDSKSGKELAGAVLTNVLLFFLIFGLSATVDCKNLKRQLSNKFAICTGVAMQFLIMPVLGYLAVTVFQHHGLTEAMGVTLLVVTASPGGSFSNWFCSTFNADLALSVAMTTVSSILSIALLPANLFFYTFLAYGGAENDEGQSVIQALDFGTIFISLGIVLSAITAGLGAGYKFDTHGFHKVCNQIGTICGLLLVLFSVFLSSGAGGAEAKLWNQSWSFYLAVAFPCLVGIALSNIIARSVHLTPPETVAISIECCYQNTGIATSVAITMFNNVEDRAQAVAVPLFYGIVEAVVIGAYCIYAWKVGWTKAPRDEKLCVIITKTYEVGDEDENDNPVSPDAVEGEEEHCDLEDGVCREEVVPVVPQPSFFAKLFTSNQEADSSEIAITNKSASLEADNNTANNNNNNNNEAAAEEGPEVSGEECYKTPQRKRIVSDYTANTAETSFTSESLPPSASSPQQTSSRQDFSFTSETPNKNNNNDNVATILEASESCDNELDDDDKTNDDTEEFIMDDVVRKTL